ncbi:MAG: hypothetical protein CVV27_10290, partial [Candidatus Melainabacteria bacterium HGW-Melainabacteria-1]
MKKLGKAKPNPDSFQARADALQAAIRAQPGEPAGYLELGALLEASRQPEIALQIYAQGLSRLPDHGPLQLRAGLLASALGRFIQALPLLEGARRQATVPGLTLLEALSNVQIQCGRHAAARDTLEALLQAVPDHALSHCRLALALQHCGELNLAREQYVLALSLEPVPSTSALAAQIYNNLGNLDRLLGAEADARSAYEQALRLDPELPEARFNLGRLLDQAGYFEDVVASYQLFIATHPNHAEVPRLLVRIGEVLRYNNQLARALPYLEQALRLDPNCLAAYNQLGLLLLEENEPEKARRCFEQALSLKPDLKATRLVLGAAIQAEGDLHAAEVHFRELLAEDPENIFARMGIASAAQQQGDAHTAEILLDEVLAARPEQLEAIAGKAQVLEKQRRFEECYQLLKPLIDSGVQHGAIAESYALACLRTKRYAEPLAYLDQVLADPDLHFHQRRGILFRLGDLHDKLKQPEKAFPCYVSANALKPQRFDPNYFVAETDAIIGAFDAGLLAALGERWPGSDSHRPILIVGMPRSGTTLTEQILASHPQVFGAGELNQLSHCFKELLPEDLAMTADDLREHLLSLPPAAYERAAQTYLDHLTEISGGQDCLRITDKMPANFRYLGLIKVLFPHARLIHCSRHPLDVCLSCFTHDFRHLEFTNDLYSLGLYYQQYQRYMAHWRTIPDLGLFEA